MEFASLGSGSSGNGVLIRQADALLLVDCGFTMKEATIRMEKLGVHPSELSAVLVTHEHGDHMGGVGPLSRKYKLPVWMTHGTWEGGKRKVQPSSWVYPEHAFTIGGIRVLPVLVPHDAREPVQFIFTSCSETSTGEALQSLGVLTDLGHISEHVADAYQQCTALMLEANHDLEMLRTGPYPPSLKRRVSGQWGHLNNDQGRALAARYLCEENARLSLLVWSHVSQQNNATDLVREMSNSIDHPVAHSALIVEQDDVLEWQPVPEVGQVEQNEQDEIAL